MLALGPGRVVAAGVGVTPSSWGDAANFVHHGVAVVGSFEWVVFIIGRTFGLKSSEVPVINSQKCLNY